MKYRACCPNCSEKFPRRWVLVPGNKPRQCPRCSAAVRQIPIWNRIGNLAFGIPLGVAWAVLFAACLVDWRFVFLFLFVTVAWLSLAYSAYPYGSPYELVVVPLKCLTCGYDLTGNVSGVCPECGQPVPREGTCHGVWHNGEFMTLVIERVTAPTPDASMLITELEAELSATYSAEQRHGLSVERVFQPNVLFFIAHLSGQAVGCGGIALADGFAEVKRMYVRPQARGRGIAQAILGRLEQEARSRGMNLLMLETGDAQQSATRLYEKAGFKRCGAFGEYATMPQDAIKRSVFFEKRLTAS